MGKVIPWRPPAGRQPLRGGADVCAMCGHKINVHIRHPNGATSCAARGCKYEKRPQA